MKYALISTIEVDEPYRFCQVSDYKFPVTEPAFFWVECEDFVSTQTHSYTGEEFIELQNTTNT